ncbi:MAG: DUF2339 domain-containing protein [Candidatus Sericytochromatia bacterium]
MTDPLDSETELRALRRQHAEMGRRLSALEQQLGVVPARTQLGTTGKSDGAKPSRLPLAIPANLEQLIGLQGFSWLGILALVTGLGLFIRYAFLEGWLGPLAILLGGAAVGAAMIGAGEWIARKELYRTWAHALMGGGVAVLYFLVYASYHFEYFRAVTHLNQVTDTLLMMAVVGLAIFLALRRKSQSLASRAFVLGFATSLLSRELVMLTLVYNLLLSVGLVGVVAVCRWQGLGLMGVIGSYALHGLWLLANPDAALLAQAVLLIYFGLYALVSDQIETRPPAEPEPDRVSLARLGLKIDPFWHSGAALELVNLIGFEVLALLLLTNLSQWQSLGGILVWLAIGIYQQLRLLPRGVSRHWQCLFAVHLLLAIVLGDMALSAQAGDQIHARSLLLACWAAGMAGWSHLIGRWDAPLLRTLCQWLTAGCLAGLLALEAPAHGLGLLWAAEAAGLLWLSRQRVQMLPAGLLLVLATAVQLVLIDFPTTYPDVAGWGPPLPVALHGAAVTLLLIVAWQANDAEQPLYKHALNWPAGIALSVFLGFVLPATGFSLGWAIAGCALVLAGFLLHHALLRFQGLALLLLTGAKVFLVDLRELAMGWRILSLLVLGGLLLGIALIYTRRQSKESSEQLTVNSEQ